MAEQPAEFATRRSSEPQIACAIDLGWRMAELFGLESGELSHAAADNLLPGRTSLPPSERLVLELRAAAGDARRAGAPIGDQELSELLGLAEEAPGDRDKEQRLRDRLRAWHVRLETDLWAAQEAKGKAYELGNFLSDTWNRTVRALRAGDGAALCSELRSVFSAERVERIKVLLDELQARLDPAAVRIVHRQLDTWHNRIDGLDELPFEPTIAKLEPLRDQAITWRQLVTGDKEPEAFIDRTERGKVGGVMVKRILDSYRRHAGVWVGVVIVAVAVAVTAVLFAGPFAGWFNAHKALASGIVGFIGTIATALGVTSASVGATVRKSIDKRAELMWNAALSEVICEQTLYVDKLIPAPARSRAERVRHMLHMEARKAARQLEPKPPLTPQH